MSWPIATAELRTAIDAARRDGRIGAGSGSAGGAHRGRARSRRAASGRPPRAIRPTCAASRTRRANRANSALRQSLARQRAGRRRDAAARRAGPRRRAIPSPRRQLRRDARRQLAAVGRLAGSLVGRRPGRQPAALVQRAPGVRVLARPRDLASVRDALAELDRSLDPRHVHGRARGPPAGQQSRAALGDPRVGAAAARLRVQRHAQCAVLRRQATLRRSARSGTSSSATTTSASTSSAADEPGNQLATYEARWGGRIAGRPVAFQFQNTGETIDNKFPRPLRTLSLINASTWGTLGRRRHAGRRTSSSRPRPARISTMRRAPTAPTRTACSRAGYRYRGRVLGHSTDSDSRQWAVGMLLDEGKPQLDRAPAPRGDQPHRHRAAVEPSAVDGTAGVVGRRKDC